MQETRTTKKRLIAGGCGLLLLCVGAGSLALWNDAATVSAGSVGSGQLNIAAQPGTWKNTQVKNWVPGTTNQYSTEVVMTVAGDSLESELGVDALSVHPSDASNPADVALAQALEISLAHGEVKGSGTLGAETSRHTFPVIPATPSQKTELTVPVTVTVTLPANVSDPAAQNGSVNLGDLAFTLQQVLSDSAKQRFKDLDHAAAEYCERITPVAPTHTCVVGATHLRRDRGVLGGARLVGGAAGVRDLG